MAKQTKKSPARRVPRAAEPRMYGDGKPAQPADAQQATAAEPVKTVAPTSPYSTGASARPTTGRTPTVRSAGATPRGAGAAGSFARVDRITDYSYVMNDLRRLGITAVAILAGLVVLGIIVR